MASLESSTLGSSPVQQPRIIMGEPVSSLPAAEAQVYYDTAVGIFNLQIMAPGCGGALIEASTVLTGRSMTHLRAAMQSTVPAVHVWKAHSSPAVSARSRPLRGLSVPSVRQEAALVVQRHHCPRLKHLHPPRQAEMEWRWAAWAAYGRQWHPSCSIMLEVCRHTGLLRFLPQIHGRLPAFLLLLLRRMGARQRHCCGGDAVRHCGHQAGNSDYRRQCGGPGPARRRPWRFRP